MGVLSTRMRFTATPLRPTTNPLWSYRNARYEMPTTPPLNFRSAKTTLNGALFSDKWNRGQATFSVHLGEMKTATVYYDKRKKFEVSTSQVTDSDVYETDSRPLRATEAKALVWHINRLEKHEPAYRDFQKFIEPLLKVK